MTAAHIISDHNLWLIILAVAVCFVGAIVGILLWDRAIKDCGRERIGWVILSAVILGGTVWNTHFVAMLGYAGSAAAKFDFSLTALSIAAAVVGMSLAITVSVKLRSSFGQISAGIILSLAVASMHYIGMLGFQADFKLSLAEIWTSKAILIGSVFGVLCTWLIHTSKTTNLRFLSTVCTFSLSVISTHFIAMAAFHKEKAHLLDMGLQSTHYEMAVAVSVVTMLLIGTGVSSYLVEARMSATSTQKLMESARTDNLTGIANRTSFMEELEISCASVERGETSLALLIVNLDRFKPVNEVFGHLVGDAVLRRVVERLQSLIRPQDRIARIGGDEFAIVVTGVAPTDLETELMAASVIDVLDRPFLMDTRIIEIGASIGIADVAQGQECSAISVCRDADMALHEAKSNGRATWYRFDETLALKFDRRSQLEYDLRRAVSRSEFELHFQPVIDHISRAFVGAETLIRWRHPQHGLIPPSEFIPLAEELGLIVPIGRWVVETACSLALDWPEHWTVSVNVSPMQLRDVRMIQTVQNALDQSGLAPHRLDLEITESALLEDHEKGVDILNRLKGLGVTITLDDFGTGFSSLSHLREFPLDRLKIDRSFIVAAEQNEKSRGILEVIGNLGAVLGIGVTAEGVETELQLELAIASGCDVIQGYLISRPLSQVHLIEMIRLDRGGYCPNELKAII